MIRIENANKVYTLKSRQEFHAIKNISIDIPQGQILGLIGPSGSGKSTSLRLLNLLEKPDSGHVYINNQDLLNLRSNDLRKLRQKIGMIFQSFELLSNLNVQENVALALKIAGWNQPDIQKRVDECLELVQLADKRQNFPAQLSGGQKQRVAIARAIANHPYLLLADEPTSALDPLTKREVVNCLKNVNTQLGLTIVIATHEMSVVRDLCHQAVLLKSGEIHEHLKIQNGQIQSQTPFGKEFLEVF